MLPTTGEVHAALQHIVDHRNERSLNYAVNYARYGLTVVDRNELRVQCLYVLCNMTRWRGDLAKEVRQVLKRYTACKA